MSSAALSASVCVGDPTGTPTILAGFPEKTGVAVALESIPVFVDGPATK